MRLWAAVRRCSYHTAAAPFAQGGLRPARPRCYYKKAEIQKNGGKTNGNDFFSRRLDLFGPEIFAALNDKKIALEAQGRTLYNLSVGTPDFPPAPHIKQALIDAAARDESWKYTLRDIPELLAAVGSYYQRRFGVAGITPDRVMSFSGSQDGIGHLGLALLNEGDTVLLPDPCYPVFMTGMRLAAACRTSTR